MTVSTGKGNYQDVWSKQTYESERELVIERVRVIEEDLASDADYSKKRLTARSDGKHYVDATDYWLRKPKDSPGRVIETPQKFTFRDMDFDWMTGDSTFAPDENERAVAAWLAERFGGTVQLMPRIDNPDFIRVGDYLWNGVTYDLKSTIGSGKRTIFKRLKSARGQTNRVILNTASCPLSQESIREQCENAMETEDWLDQIIIITGETNGKNELVKDTIQLLGVYERV